MKPVCQQEKQGSTYDKYFFKLLATNCLSVFDHFVGLAVKGLRKSGKDLHLSTVIVNENSEQISLFRFSYFLKMKQISAIW